MIYIDAKGEEIFPARRSGFPGLLDAQQHATAAALRHRRALRSGDGQGRVGRNLTHQVSFAPAQAFFDKPLNRFMGAATGGRGAWPISMATSSITQFAVLARRNARADRHGLPAHRRALASCRPSVKARWGSEWKKAAVDWYDRVGRDRLCRRAHRLQDHYMDLDPTYKDHLGDPLLRLTLDWHDNERNMVGVRSSPKPSNSPAPWARKEIVPAPSYGRYDARALPIHARAGRHDHGQVAGTLRWSTPYGQHWRSPNLFVMGASTFPQNPSGNPTLTAVALTYRAADAVVESYLRHPGLL